MAQRIVRNDFVAGEISPELWGRHDVDLYYHGAAKIENFVPRRTGGLRKRAGTELIACFSRYRAQDDPNTSTESRAIPYKYDKDHYGILLIYRDTGGTRLLWSLYSSVARAFTVGRYIRADVVTVPASATLADIRYTQIGDTIFFTLPGVTAWKAVVSFPTRGNLPTVEWESLSTERQVDSAPQLTTTPHNFGDGDGYTAGERKYRLWGVKDGVRGEPYDKTQAITLEWKAGAYIDATFTPDWSKHDYYILAKLQGGQYGEVSRFYPSSCGETTKDTISSFSDNTSACSQLGNNAGSTSPATYSANAANSTGWIKRKPNDLTNGGRHVYGTFASSFHANIASKFQALSVSAVKIWFGAKMAVGLGGQEIENVGCAETVQVLVLNGAMDDPNSAVIYQGSFVPGYNTGATTLNMSTVASASDVYVYFRTGYVNRENIGTAMYVPVRGMRVVCTKTTTCTFKDDNISPGTLVGEQTALTVGETDMDVNLITAWQQRLVAAGCGSLPFTLWFSAVGDLYNFYQDTPQVQDNAFEATIASTEANRINHIVAQKWLLVFTESGEYIIDSTGGALAFNTCEIKKLSSVVAHNAIPPVCTESEVLFVAHDGRSAYKMDYTLERDSVVPTNLSIRAEHVAAAAGIVAIAYQRFPDSVLWCLLSDGTLASLTFCPEENVCAWAHHTLAGGAGLKAIDIISTGSVSSGEGTATTSDVFLVLRNTSDPDKTWIERLRPNVIEDDPSASAALCADHMGYGIGTYPTLEGASKDPQENIAASFETIRMEPQQPDTIGKAGAQFEATLRVLRSGKLAVAPVTEDGMGQWRDNGTQTRKMPAEAGGKVALVRSDVRISPQVLYNRECRFAVKSADQWPCDILALCLLGNFGTMKEGG